MPGHDGKFSICRLEKCKTSCRSCPKRDKLEGIPQEFQAIVDPVLWDPHERQARQLPRGQARDENAIDA